jgi:peptidoglycan/xylan/chitin deacetylase (PgdA/CDA1 family)
MSERQIPILVYHHVYAEDDPELVAADFETGAGIIGVDAFRQQMTYARESGWNTVSTAEVVDWVEGVGDLPEKSFALHFDNGWLDTVTTAMPVTEDFGFSAMCFPITDGVEASTQGRAAAVRTLTEGVVEKPFMTWDQIGELVSGGWEIGAHTATHCKVADMHESEGDAGVIREAEVANEIFDTRIGNVPAHFAYPSGSRNDRTDELLGAFYRSLRLWHFEPSAQWTYTDRTTSLLAIDCQNIDLRVPMADFESIFTQAGQ